MNKKLLYFLLVFIQYANAQSLEFTYDNNGNQTKRELVLIVNTMSTFSYDENEEENETSLPKSYSLNENSTLIEIFPNPVVDNLTIRWPSDIAISQIYLFDNQGKLLQVKKVENDTFIQNILFDSYASGIYYIRLYDGEQQSKTFKVIKK